MGERGSDFGLEFVREKEKPREVVRVCVTRSRRSKEFNHIFKNKKREINYDDLLDVDFVSFMMAEKSPESHNPGQIMPVGGKVEDGESTESAAVRKLMEETHLRPVNRISKIGRINYEIPGRGTKIDASYVGTRILSTDYPYPINPKKDNINSFHYFTLKEFNEMLVLGRSVKNHGDAVLLDSLQVPYAEKDNPDTEKIKLNAALSEYLRGEEKVKKTDVILKWFEVGSEIFYTPELKHKVEEWKNRLQTEGTDIYTVQSIWRDIIMELSERQIDFSKVKQTLFKAIDLSNFSECVQENEEDEFNVRSELEGGLYLVYALLETYHIDKEFLEIAKQNSKLAPFVKKIETFLSSFSSDQAGIEEQLKNFGEVLSGSDREKVEAKFCGAFGIKPEELARKLNAMDTFLDDLINNAIISVVDDSVSSNQIQQNNEIRGADLTTLLRKAFPKADESWKINYQTSGEKSKSRASLKVMSFEARRKLALLVLASAAEDDYVYRQNEYSVDFEQILKGFISAPIYEFEIFSDKESEPRLVVNEADVEDTNFSTEQLTDVSHSFLRRMSGVENCPAYFFDIDKGSPKTWPSFLRKMATRSIDDPKKVMDYLRRSIIVATVDTRGMNERDALMANERLYERETRRIPNVFAPKSDGKPLKDVTDISVVLDFMEKLILTPGVKLIGFKSTPLPGEKIESEGSGGGGDVRFAKFYIEVADSKGRVRHEEVQIYTPTKDDGVYTSAFYYREQKDRDDVRYYFQRLLYTKGLHSAVDIFFPPGIYGKLILEAKKKMGKQKAG